VKRGLGEGDWCFRGDFNVVCFPKEKTGVSEGSLASSVVNMNFLKRL